MCFVKVSFILTETPRYFILCIMLCSSFVFLLLKIISSVFCVLMLVFHFAKYLATSVTCCCFSCVVFRKGLRIVIIVTFLYLSGISLIVLCLL